MTFVPVMVDVLLATVVAWVVLVLWLAGLVVAAVVVRGVSGAIGERKR